MTTPTTPATAVPVPGSHAGARRSRTPATRRVGVGGRRGYGRGQRGATTVQVVLIAPLLMLTLMTIVQAGLIFYAQAVVEAAAQEGAAEARRFDGTEAGAQSRTETYLEALNSKILEGRSVQVTRSAETAEVTVTGSVISLVPFLELEIQESATGPVERYVPPVNAGGAP